MKRQSEELKKNAKKVKESSIAVEIKGKNEMEDLEELFESGLSKYNEKDEEAKLLFRGVVHECDKMLRVRNGDFPKSSEEELEILRKAIVECPILPYKFYIIYANSLYYLSIIDADDPLSFLEEGLSRVESAIEEGACPECYFTRARLLLQKASLLQDDESNKLFRDNFTLVLQEGLKTLPLSLELAHLAHLFVETLESIEDKMEWIEYNATNWASILKAAVGIDSSLLQAYIGLGNSHLWVADEMIEYGSESQTGIISVLREAIGSFSSAQTIAERTSVPLIHIYLLLGETNVHLGNLLDEDDEENTESLDCYKLAVSLFEKAEIIDKDCLPDQLKQFLQEWQQDMLTDEV